MSRTGFIAGLIISAVFHLWMLRYLPMDAFADNVDPAKNKIVTVDVVKVKKPQEKIAVQHPEPDKQSPPDSQYEKPTQPIELVKSNKESLSKSVEQGSFSGTASGVERPILRINWGSSTQAVATLRASGMKLVILGSGGIISNELIPVSTDLWKVEPLAIEAGQRYSDSLRVVDKVPAFASARIYIETGSNQSLAVLMPVDVEKMIETTKITYVHQRVLRMQDISTFGGYFSVNNGKVDFMIEKVQLRR